MPHVFKHQLLYNISKLYGSKVTVTLLHVFHDHHVDNIEGGELNIECPLVVC
jgi:hypothetical protein